MTRSEKDKAFINAFYKAFPCPDSAKFLLTQKHAATTSLKKVQSSIFSSGSLPLCVVALEQDIEKVATLKDKDDSLDNYTYLEVVLYLYFKSQKIKGNKAKGYNPYAVLKTLSNNTNIERSLFKLSSKLTGGSKSATMSVA